MQAAEIDDEAASEEHAEGAFTRYLRALAAPSDALEMRYREMWRELRGVLMHELRRRSLWSSSPRYVGILGAESFAAGPGAGEALEELLHGCYLHVFGHQLRLLLARLEVWPAADGLVVFFVRDFVGQRQKDHDPLGYRVFEIVRQAVRDAVAAGELHVVRREVLRGKPTIGSRTVLAAAPELEPARAVAPEVLAPIVRRWNDELMPALITAAGPARRQVVEQLRRRLFELEAEEVLVFRVKDVIDPLRHDVRARWSALWERSADTLEMPVASEQGGVVRALVQIFRPVSRAEDLESFRKLVACVAERVDKLEAPARTRRYLDTVWSFLRRFALDDACDLLPSDRKMSAALRIPRERLPGLYAKLGELVRRCQAAFSGAVVELDGSRRRAAGGRHG